MPAAPAALMPGARALAAGAAGRRRAHPHPAVGQRQPAAQRHDRGAEPDPGRQRVVVQPQHRRAVALLAQHGVEVGGSQVVWIAASVVVVRRQREGAPLRRQHRRPARRRASPSPSRGGRSQFGPGDVAPRRPAGSRSRRGETLSPGCSAASVSRGQPHAGQAEDRHAHARHAPPPRPRPRAAGPGARDQAARGPAEQRDRGRRRRPAPPAISQAAAAKPSAGPIALARQQPGTARRRRKAASAAHHSRCSAGHSRARFQASIGPTAMAAISGAASGSIAVLKKGGPTEIFCPSSRSANIG